MCDITGDGYDGQFCPVSKIDQRYIQFHFRRLFVHLISEHPTEMKRKFIYLIVMHNALYRFSEYQNDINIIFDEYIYE